MTISKKIDIFRYDLAISRIEVALVLVTHKKELVSVYELSEMNFPHIECTEYCSLKSHSLIGMLSGF